MRGWGPDSPQGHLRDTSGLSRLYTIVCNLYTETKITPVGCPAVPEHDHAGSMQPVLQAWEVPGRCTEQSGVRWCRRSDLHSNYKITKISWSYSLIWRVKHTWSVYELKIDRCSKKELCAEVSRRCPRGVPEVISKRKWCRESEK